MAQQLLDPQEVVSELDLSHLVIEDDRRWLRWCDRAGNIISTGAFSAPDSFCSQRPNPDYFLKID
jgi:hypothetical protein